MSMSGQLHTPAALIAPVSLTSELSSVDYSTCVDPFQNTNNKS
jgi:hypothetical protein